MLEIQKYIINHSNWYNLLQEEPYNLKIRNKDNLYKFDYTIDSKDSATTREARGLILDADNSIIAKSFTRFYNYEEHIDENFDWSNIIISEKIDGSMIQLYYYNGNWHWTTRSSFDACDVVLNNKWNFQDLINRANKNLDYEKLNKNYCYTFELVSPENQVVVYYDKPKLYGIYIYDLLNDKELNYEDEKIKFDKIGFEMPFSMKLTNENYEHIREKFVDNRKTKEFEGVVLRDKNDNRLKVKTLEWIKAHKLQNNGVLTTKRIIEMSLANELTEYLAYFPQKKDECYKVIKTLTKISEAFLIMYTKLPKIREENYDNKSFWLNFVCKKTENAYIRNLICYFSNCGDIKDKWNLQDLIKCYELYANGGFGFVEELK